MRNTAFAWIVLTALAGGCDGKKDVTGPEAATSASTSVTTLPTTAGTVSVPVGAPLSFAPIAKAADPSVVTINSISEETAVSFSGKVRRRELKGLGTGFIIDKDGTIVTNNHVIEGPDGNIAPTISVRTSDDKVLDARVLGRDPLTDIAALKVDLKDAPALALGDSDVLDVGDWVVAIGNPFGLNHTVSAGIVSAKGRTKEDVPLDPSGYYDFIQTDASINPGNSGGPLLNLKGEVVGINTAIRGGGAQGIGFAIPINEIRQLLPMILRDGHVTRSAMGVRIRDVRELAPEDRTALKLTDDKGVVIEDVQGGGPAAKGGLEAGDVILEFDGTPVDKSTRLQWMASVAGVGKTVKLKILRQGKPMDMKVVLGLLPDPPRTRPQH
jgi:serine protease Do